MKINYKNAEGKIIELEVSEEVGTFYLESTEAEKKNRLPFWTDTGLSALFSQLRGAWTERV